MLSSASQEAPVDQNQMVHNNKHSKYKKYMKGRKQVHCKSEEFNYKIDNKISKIKL